MHFSNSDSDDLKVFSESLEPFTFDWKLANPHIKELNTNLDKLKNRIQRLVDEATIDDQPVLGSLLQFFPHASSEDLMKVGKALQRVAELLPEYQKLNSRKSFIDIAQKDSEWLLGTFGDLGSHIDSFIENALSSGDSNEDSI